MTDPLATRRQTYAAAVMRNAGVNDPKIEAAFAAVPREDFAGAPPWRIASGAFGFDSTADPERLYEDVLVGIDARRGINNGQPSLHAQSIDALGLREGETVVQIGAGAGYYTAILATLVGPKGRVIAYEIEPDIAERAAANLARYPQVEVRARSGVEDLPAADAIYVNAAASHPLRAWLDALNLGGRLRLSSPGRGIDRVDAYRDAARTRRCVAGAPVLGRGVHPLRRGARSRNGPQTRRGVAPRRRGDGCARCALAARPATPTGFEATAGRCRPSRRGSALAPSVGAWASPTNRGVANTTSGRISCK